MELGTPPLNFIVFSCLTADEFHFSMLTYPVSSIHQIKFEIKGLKIRGKNWIIDN